MSYANETSNRRGKGLYLGLGGLLVAGAVTVGIAPNAATAAITSAPPQVRTSQLQADLDAMVDAGAPGAILLVRDGKRTTRLASGLGDIANGTPMQTNDHFKIASLTKTFTATVVLQLVEERKLRLTDTVEKWLPGLVPNGENITVRMLLNHTSGIDDYEGDPRFLEPYFAGDLGFAWTQRQLVEFAVSHGPLFPPGQTTTYSYSNTNYVLAGMIVETVTGRSMANELQRRIFGPLHLHDSSYPSEPGLPSPYAHGYMVLGEPPAVDVTGLSPSFTSSAGAIVSTADDVVDFNRALLSGHLLRHDLLRQMKSTNPAPSDHSDFPGQGYGLGLEMFPTSCGNAWGHNGVVPGYFTYVFSSANGQRQALLTVNHDAQTLPPEIGPMFFGLIDKAFCSTSDR